MTLGEWYYRRYRHSPYSVYNPWNERHVRDYWFRPHRADQLTDDEYGLKKGTSYIQLDPNELILSHTQEFIGGKHHITTMMKARSSFRSIGNFGLSMCRLGDVDYINRWTMEIHNSLEVPVILPVGVRVAQIVFMWSGVPEKPYTGKYQLSSNIDELTKSWKPDSMLPKLYLDKL